MLNTPRMSFSKRATTIPAPLVVDPSQSFEGADGSWSTFTIAIVRELKLNFSMPFINQVILREPLRSRSTFSSRPKAPSLGSLCLTGAQLKETLPTAPHCAESSPLMDSLREDLN